MKIKIALIGAGFISDYHARGLQTLANVKIVAVVSKNLENAKKFALKYHIKEALTDISSLVKRDDLDAVIISTPNQFHAPYAIAFLQNGKDVFLEKPMGMSGDEGKQIAEAANKYNQLVMVGHMWRFDADTCYIRDTVASGTIGRVFKTKGYGIHENWGPSGWFTQKEMAGGGALADMGVHAIDAVRYILGDPNPIKVYARISTELEIMMWTIAQSWSLHGTMVPKVLLKVDGGIPIWTDPRPVPVCSGQKAMPICFPHF